MDNESSISYSSSAPVSNNSNSNMFLKQANKNSHKIAKPLRKPLPNPTATSSSSSIPAFYPNPHNPGPPQSQQPAVYNINKNDFRDVVQRLTGSPAHERLQTPPPPPPQATQPRPPSSRLQRIRPPPLAQISNRPNQIAQIHRPHPPNDAGQRPPPPHGQPFPPVHAVAESPISAYMRFLQNSASPLAPSPIWNGIAQMGGGPRPDSFPPQNEFGQRPPPPPLSPMHPAESPISAYMRFLQHSAASPAAPSPLWNGPRPDSVMPQNEFGQRPPPPPFSPLQPVESPVSAYMRFLQNSGAAPPPPPPQQQMPLTPSGAFPTPFPAMPLSPLPFGCIPSPRSPYGMMSPGFLFSPMGQLGLPQLPLSPTLPVPSPRWKGM